MALATLFSINWDIAYFFSFNGSPPENPGDETVGYKHSDICCLRLLVLFFIRQMA